MGYIRHNAIVITSWSDGAIKRAAAKARELGLQVLGPSDEAINGYSSALICPDGSKEGWESSHDYDLRREQLREYLDGERYEDGSTSLEWIEVAYGSDDERADIEHHAWD